MTRLFKLSAFDVELARQRQAQENTFHNKALRSAQKGDTTSRLIAAIVLAGSAVFAATTAASVPNTPTDLVVETGMTYNGMSLDDFAAYMEMPADNPYLIAMFVALCATQEPAGAMSG